MRNVLILCILLLYSGCTPTTSSDSFGKVGKLGATRSHEALALSEIVMCFLSSEVDFYHEASKVLDVRADEAMAAQDDSKWDKYLEAKRVLMLWRRLLYAVNAELEKGMAAEEIEEFRERLQVNIQPGFLARTDANSILVELFAAGVDVRMYMVKVLDEGPPPLRPFPFRKLGEESTRPTSRNARGNATTTSE